MDIGSIVSGVLGTKAAEDGSGGKGILGIVGKLLPVAAAVFGI